MEKPLVSVVLPIYNVEKYLDRCITSVVNQTYKNLEIILVDDGSPDRCPRMCEDWAEKDSRIQVVHKKNAGLGMARNTGIEHASGTYICFFDSDDYVEETTVEKALLLAKKEQADIVVFGAARVDREGKIKNKIIPTSGKLCYSGKEVCDVFLPDLIDSSVRAASVKNLCFSAWSCLFSLELIKKTNWRFVSEREIISEDSFSLLCLYRDVNCVAILQEALYYYCENGSSLTQTYREDRYEKLKQYYAASLNLVEQKCYSKAVSERIASLFFSYTIGAMKQIVAADLSLRKRKDLLAQIVHDEMMCRAAGNLTPHYCSWAKNILCWALCKEKPNLVFLLVKLQNMRNR